MLYVTAIFISSLLSVSAAEPLLPQKPGGQWVLNTIYAPDPIQFEIQSVTTYGPRTVIDFLQTYPWATYSLLLSQNANGLSFEGFRVGGATYWAASPTPLFRQDVTPGQTWSTALGTVGLLSKTGKATVEGQSVSGVYLYSVGSTSQIWGFRPGFGIVSYKLNGIDFTLTSNKAGSTPAPPQLSARSCPLVGLTAIPEDNQLTDAQRAGILQKATTAGSRNLIVGATWTQLEPSQGAYNLSRIDKELRLAANQNLPVVFNLRVPQTVAPALPGYLSGKSLNDPVVLSRLNELLKRIVPLLPPQVTWVNIGYEVDTFSFLRPQDVGGYMALFTSAKSRLKSLRPGISVGQVFSFDSTRANDQMFKQLVSNADHVAFTYYALSGDYEQREARSPAFDIPLMVSIAAGKPILLVEAGYSSNWAGEAAQSEFVSQLFGALRKAGGAIQLFSIWSYADIPASLLPTLSMEFGQTSDAFGQFITSTGLVRQSGAAKQSFTTFVSEASKTHAGACTGP